MVNLMTYSAAALVVLAVSSCAVGPNYSRPEKVGAIELQQAFTPAQHAMSWWQTFNDQELNRLVQVALQQNRSLAVAQANVEQASALFQDANNDGLPKGSLDATYQASENGTIAVADDNVVSRGNTFGTNLTWDLDLFGKIQRATEAAAANAQQAQALLREAQVQIISQVASTYGDYRSAQLRLKLAEENLQNLQQSRDIVEVRLNTGFASEFELASIDSQYYEIKATIPRFQSALLRAHSTLSALLGYRPEQLVLSDKGTLPELAEAISIEDSRSYLRYRPDIASAERKLAATTANIGAVTADLYPSISVKGFLGFVSSPGLALNDANSSWSLAPTLSWQGTDLGSVKARIRAANANAKGALAEFEQRIIEAVNEIQLSLQSYNLSREQASWTHEQFKASTQAMIIARVRYDAGNGEFYDLLDAERYWLQSREQLAQVQLLEFTQLVEIYRAFGGSLEIQRQPAKTVN